MAKSNYEIMRDRMRLEFIKYDQGEMVRKFALRQDEKYLYIDFVGRPYRIDRASGVVEWSEDGFATCTEGDYNESMTIYDVLCCSKPDCTLSGRFAPASMLKGTVQSSGLGGKFFQSTADALQGRVPELKRACARLGEPAKLGGDAAFVLYPFSFLPITLQYWEADEEFPANLKIMFDENIMAFMHYETTYFMVGHILKRILEMMESSGKTEEKLC